MAGSYTHTETDGNTTTKTEYTCTKKGMQYTIIGDEIKADFDFLKSNNEIAAKLDEMLSHLSNAAAITDAFYFENGGTASDVNHAYEEIKADVEKLKTQLDTLHAAFMTDIDNVNAELKVNFGHWIGVKVNEGKKTTTTNSN